jgi:hypothetical protein
LHGKENQQISLEPSQLPRRRNWHIIKLVNEIHRDQIIHKVIFKFD